MNFLEQQCESARRVIKTGTLDEAKQQFMLELSSVHNFLESEPDNADSSLGDYVLNLVAAFCYRDRSGCRDCLLLGVDGSFQCIARELNAYSTVHELKYKVKTMYGFVKYKRV